MKIIPSIKNMIKDEVNGSEKDLDDMRILDSRMELDKAKNGMSYYLYHLATKDAGKIDSFWKAVKLIRVNRVPVKLRTNMEMMDIHRDICSSMWEDRTCFINLIGNSTVSRIGTIFAYGVQATGKEPGEAKYIADAKMAGLVSALEGSYSQIELIPISVEVGGWILDKLEHMKEILVVRGVPRPRNVTSAEKKADQSGQKNYSMEEQIEEIIRGMANHNYLIVTIGTPVDAIHINRWLEIVNQELSRFKSQVNGSRSIGVNLVLPIGMVGSLGEGKGYSQGQNNSQMYDLSTMRSHTDSVNMSQTEGQSWSTSHLDNISMQRSYDQSDSLSAQISRGRSYGNSLSSSISENYGVGRSQSINESMGFQTGVGEDYGVSYGKSEGESLSWSKSAGAGHGSSESFSESGASGESGSDSLTTSHSETTSVHDSYKINDTEGISEGTIVSSSESEGGGGQILFVKVGDQYVQVHSSSFSASDLVSQPAAVADINSSDTVTTLDLEGSSWSRMNTWAKQDAASRNVMTTENFEGSESQSHSENLSLQQGVSSADSMSFRTGSSVGTNQSVNTSSGQSLSSGGSLTNGGTRGQSFTDGYGFSQNAGYGYSQGGSVSSTQGQMSSVTTGTGEGQGYSEMQGISQSLMRTSAIAASVGVIPSIFWMKAYQTYEANAANITEVLDVFRNRLMIALQEGGHYYEMYVLTDEVEAKSKMRALVKSAWWGKNTWPTPIEAIDLQPSKAAHMSYHAQAWSFCRERAESINQVEPYKFSTFINSNEFAALTHPPRVEAPGLSTTMEQIPDYRLPTIDRNKRHMNLGYVISGETGKTVYSLPRVVTEDQYKGHVLVSGVTGFGKSVTAMRYVYEAIKNFGCSAVILDWARQYRALKNVVESLEGPNGKRFKFKFWSLGDVNNCPIGFNLLAAPDGIDAETWAALIAQNFALAYSLGTRGYGIVFSLLDRLYNRVGAYEEPRNTRLVDMVDLYKEIANEMNRLDKDLKDKIGSDYKDRVAIIMSRLRFFAPHTYLASIYSKDGTVFNGKRFQTTIDDFLGNDTVIVLEGWGLDHLSKAFIIGLIASGIFAKGRVLGDGAFLEGDLGGKILLLEEGHQILSGVMEDDNAVLDIPETWAEVMWNESRSLGLFGITCVQSVSRLPKAIVQNSTGVIAHRAEVEKDKQIIVSKSGKEYRLEDRDLFKYLSRMSRGDAVTRFGFFEEYLDSEPVLMHTKPLTLTEPTNEELQKLYR